MWRKLLVSVLGVVLVGLLHPAAKAEPQKGKGPINKDNKAWLIRYHRTSENPRHKGKAVRLKIEKVDNTTMKGTLRIYRGVSGGAYSNAELINDLTGPAPQEHGLNRKLLTFELKSASKPIIVKGFFITGRSKEDSDVGREDDMLLVRIIDTSRKPSTDDPCDVSPPDEDVLTEESDTTEPPVYDGGS